VVTEFTGWAADADALAAFLAEANLGRLGTIDADGDPHIVPVWFAWDGERFLIGSDAADHKVENLRRAGRASLEIDSDLRRKRGVLVRGQARLIDGPEARQRYRAVSELQLPRYRPDAPVTETAARMASRGEPVVIEIEPRTIVSWGR
jgi:PPOX class probable F420-dependent enzyme